MTSNEPVPAGGTDADRSRNQPGVLCVHCDHLNYLGQETCERCGSRLYVTCPRCGRRNMRVYTRCQHCRKRLHRRGLFRQRQHHRKTFVQKLGWQVLEVLLVLAGVAVVFGVVYLLYKL